MKKNKKLGWIIGALVLAVVVLGAFGTSIAYAGEGGPGERTGRLDGEGLEVIADLLGMTPDEVTTAIKDEGKTLQELADEAGVEMEEIKEALNALRNEAFRDRIQTALDDGDLTQDEADWLLEGLDKGYLEKLGKWFGKRGGRGGQGGFDRSNVSPKNDL